MRTFTFVFFPDPERGGSSVSCPAMPGAFSQGDTREEILSNIRESMELCEETMAEKGLGSLNEAPELIAAEAREVFSDRLELGWEPLIETAQVAINPVVALGRR